MPRFDRVKIGAEIADIIEFLSDDEVDVTWEGLDDPDHNIDTLTRVDGVWGHVDYRTKKFTPEKEPVQFFMLGEEVP